MPLEEERRHPVVGPSAGRLGLSKEVPPRESPKRLRFIRIGEQPKLGGVHTQQHHALVASLLFLRAAAAAGHAPVLVEDHVRSPPRRPLGLLVLRRSGQNHVEKGEVPLELCAFVHRGEQQEVRPGEIRKRHSVPSSVKKVHHGLGEVTDVVRHSRPAVHFHFWLALMRQRYPRAPLRF